DLWGYSNRDIAISQVCNADRMKNGENFFLDNRPDIYWSYWFTKFPQTNNFDTVELSLSEASYSTGNRGNQLGDMNGVLLSYDTFLIKNMGRQVAYLVRKDLSDSLINHLQEKGFKLLRYREMDMERFRSLYNSQKKVQYKCS